MGQTAVRLPAKEGAQGINHLAGPMGPPSSLSFRAPV